MKQLNLFIELTRLKKPIGFMLLFWPCSWGLTIAYDFSTNINSYVFFLFLFLLGSILMRSAGCIVNDIIDVNFDKRVERTKERPIASGKISKKLALIYTLVLCLFAFIVLIQFNSFTILLAVASMPLAFTYPLMKRYTYWPQLFLGITFNFGIILGWTAINGSISIAVLILYFGAIFWTLGYDTIYGFQDIKDDEIIGVKSTSIKFKRNHMLFLNICYLVFIICISILGLVMNFKYYYYFLLIIPFAHLFFYQLKKIDIKSPNTCLERFKSNNFLGLIILINLLIGKINL